MSDYDKELVITVLKNILWAIDQIDYRFDKIDSPDDFLDSEDGLAMLDGICMQLINIGEALKKVDKITKKSLLTNYPDVE